MPIGAAGSCNEQPQKTDYGERRPGGMFPCHLAGPAARIRDGPAGIDAEIGELFGQRIDLLGATI